MLKRGEHDYERKREKKREKRKERREKGKKRWSKVGDVIFSPHSSSSSDLQVESSERSQGKPRTSKFLMVGKLDFDVFHT